MKVEGLPFPHKIKGQSFSGSLLSWPNRCQHCTTNACELSESHGLNLCSYGYYYQRISKDIVIGGLVIRNAKDKSTAQRKRLFEDQNLAISIEILNAGIDSFQRAFATLDSVVASEKQRILDEYVKKERYRIDFLDALKPEIQKGLSFVHDYKQINTQISQNINAIIESHYAGSTLEEKLEQATEHEKALYEASKFLDEKLNVAKFLLHPEWLTLPYECSKFRFHGAVSKYLKIYRSRLASKNITLQVNGQSYLEMIANPQAVPVIPHTLIDNAAKYSPKDGKIIVEMQDNIDSINFSVSSFGPRISSQEKEKIFDPFFRGKAAIDMQEEGAGFGLYISQMIAKNHLGTYIQVHQDKQPTARMGYWTTFSVKLPLKAIILQDE